MAKVEIIEGAGEIDDWTDLAEERVWFLGSILE